MSRATPYITTLAILAACLTTSTHLRPVRAQSPQASDEHKVLHADVGAWDAEIKLWPVPNGQPIESKAVEKNELLPGGLWLLSRFDGEIAGIKFAGVGTFGYDPVEKKYIGTWIDNMTPHLTVIKAVYDPATKTMTGTGLGRDAATGKESATKQVSRYIDDNNRVFEMFSTGPDGKEFKMMQVNYKRRPQ